MKEWYWSLSVIHLALAFIGIGALLTGWRITIDISIWGYLSAFFIELILWGVPAYTYLVRREKS